MKTQRFAHDTYRTTAIQTASQARLISMLFEGAAKFMAQFIIAAKERRIEAAHENSMKAQRIVTELILALDHSKGGEVSRVIEAAYENIRSRMALANIRKDVAIAQAVIKDLNEFKETWVQVFKSVDFEQAPAPLFSGVSIKT